jgi:hypothetical protein
VSRRPIDTETRGKGTVPVKAIEAITQSFAEAARWSAAYPAEFRSNSLQKILSELGFNSGPLRQRLGGGVPAALCVKALISLSRLVGALHATIKPFSFHSACTVLILSHDTPVPKPEKNLLQG